MRFCTAMPSLYQAHLELDVGIGGVYVDHVEAPFPATQDEVPGVELGVCIELTLNRPPRRLLS